IFGHFFFVAISLSYLGHAAAPWHFLYFLPEPQVQGSLRPTFCEPRLTGAGASFGAPENVSGWRGGWGSIRSMRAVSDSRRSPSRSTTTSIFHRYFTTRSWTRSIISWKRSNDSFLYSMSGSRWP